MEHTIIGAWVNDRIQIVVADITTLNVDVIVNAANAALCGGGGVDGAIHRAAGPELLEECRTFGGARPGEVKVTQAYQLPSKLVAHAVGPVWDGGNKGEPALLESCYRKCLEITKERGLKTIAFPAISTGAYRFPIRDATHIAQRTVLNHLMANQLPQQVIFCCYSARDARVYEQVAHDMLDK
jgi:O-acetyl-ADP-ribose deacetylase (regulator of RNase III)